MSLIDDLKQILLRNGVAEFNANMAVLEFAKKHGGQRRYIHKKFKNCPILKT